MIQISLLEITRTSLRFLQHDVVHFSEMWDWSVFLDLLKWKGLDNVLTSEDKDVRWTSVEILSLVLRLNSTAIQGMTSGIAGLTNEDVLECQFR